MSLTAECRGEAHHRLLHLRGVRAVLEQQTANLKHQMCDIFYRRRVRSAEVCHVFLPETIYFFVRLRVSLEPKPRPKIT